MSTRIVGLPGEHAGNISPAAGIRPFQMDAVFAATSDFQAAKASGTGGQVTSAMSAGDWYLNSGNNYSLDIQGSGSLNQMGGVARVTVTSALATSVGANLNLATVVAAPGAGRVVLPRVVTIFMPSGASATDGSNWCLAYQGGTSATANLDISGVASDNTQRFVRMNVLNTLSGLDTSAVNLPLVVKRVGSLALSGSPTQSFYVTCIYDIVSLSA